MVDADLIPEVVLTYYTLTGHTIEAKEGYYLISRQPEAGEEVAGGPRPGETLAVAFCSEAVDKLSPGLEVLTYGSYRLAEIIEAIRQEGRFLQGRLTPLWPDPVRSFTLYLRRCGQAKEQEIIHLLQAKEEDEPWLILNFVAARCGADLLEQVLSPAINLCSGRVVPTLHPLLAHGKITPVNVRPRRKMSFKLAYRLLVQQAALMVAAQDLSWLSKAEETRRQEEEYLNNFYQQALQEEKNQEKQKELLLSWHRRREEVYQRYTPRLLLRPFSAALLQIPNLQAVFLCTQGENSLRLSASYDPVSGQWTNHHAEHSASL